MIDTDKYEGHTEGPWYHHMDDYVEALDLDIPLSVCTLAEGEHKDANAQLIADAPDLLAALIKEREENQRLRQYHHCLYWLYDKERFGWEVSENQWEFIGRLLGAVTDHNDNYWEGEEE
jgi:hypothetical protein